MKNSTINDVFKFVQLRGVAEPAEQPDFDPRLFRDTNFSQSVADSQTLSEAQSTAKTLLKNQDWAVTRPNSLIYGTELEQVMWAIKGQPNPTIGSIVGATKRKWEGGKDPAFTEDLSRLSDTVLAQALLNQTKESIEGLYRTYILASSVGTDDPDDQTPIATYLSGNLAQFIERFGFFGASTLLPPPWGRRKPVHSVGIGDLMVVKQHILRYERTEIAHIENIMPGEKRDRQHRFLERVEETVTLEREVNDVKERELETSERHELNKESSLTIQEDQKYGFDLSISAKYGPTLDVQSGFAFESNESRTFAAKSSSNYAKNVVDRSLQRIETKIREERIRKLIRESEETNQHSFENLPPVNSIGEVESDSETENVVGVYQFVDKIYEAQVFNYGKRQMFDLFVPEPAAYLWQLDSLPDSSSATPDIPPPPEPLTIKPSEISTEPADRNYYGELVRRYDATGVNPPPAREKTVSGTSQYPQGTDGSNLGEGGADDTGAPRFTDTLKFKIPNGYAPKQLNYSIVGSSDAPDHMRFILGFGKGTKVILGSEAEWKVHANLRAHHGSVSPFDFAQFADENEGTMSVTLLVWDSSTWQVEIEIVCSIGDQVLDKWRLETYDAIVGAYENRLSAWQARADAIRTEELAQARPEQKRVGVPPTTRKNTIISELKKHCISILTGYWYDNAPVVTNTTSPAFALERSEVYGSAVRFIEQAFEWHQLQYALYPYYWARQDTWADRLRRQDPNYEFEQFLRAGAARVVLSVRPGFEYAVSLYLEKQIIWNGRDIPPPIDDPLYLSIVDQLKEQSGEELDEPVAVGDPWEVRLPTGLVMLKPEPEPLPNWRRASEGEWRWINEDLTAPEA